MWHQQSDLQPGQSPREACQVPYGISCWHLLPMPCAGTMVTNLCVQIWAPSEQDIVRTRQECAGWAREEETVRSGWATSAAIWKLLLKKCLVFQTAMGEYNLAIWQERVWTRAALLTKPNIYMTFTINSMCLSEQAVMKKNTDISFTL